MLWSRCDKNPELAGCTDLLTKSYAAPALDAAHTFSQLYPNAAQQPTADGTSGYDPPNDGSYDGLDGYGYLSFID